MSKTYTNTEIKKTARAALKCFTGGFEPPLYQIALLESSGDRTYILFRVNDIEYRFSSYVCNHFTNEDGETVDCIWVGDGTIERLGRRTKNGLV